MNNNINKKGIVIGLTVYAVTTKTDFTMMGGTLFVAGSAFFIMGIFMIFSSTPALYTFFCCIGVILFGIYLVYDT